MVSIENNGSRLIAKSDSTPTSYQWLRADTVDGTFSAIDGATGKYYDITANDEGKYIKVSADGSESETVGPIGKLIVFDLSLGSVNFGATYSGNGGALTGDHIDSNIYVVKQSNTETYSTNTIKFSGTNLQKYDVTIDGIHLGSEPVTGKAPNSQGIGTYTQGVIDLQPSGGVGSKNVILRLKGENIVRAIHYYTNGSASNSSLKITDIKGDGAADGGALYVPVKVDPDKIEEFVNSNLSYNHWNSGIGGDDGSGDKVTNFEIAGGKLQVLTTYADNCTAIGAGGNGACTMTISGGDITAHCNGTGTAIGGGIGWFSGGGTSNITISGGNIYAKNHGQIYVNGSTITTKDKPYDKVVGGVAIGSGSSFEAAGSEGKVTITGGYIEAYGTFGNGIGGGNSSNSTGGKATISISGGTVIASSIGGGDSKSGTGGSANVEVSGTAHITLEKGVGGGSSLSGNGGAATITVSGGTLYANGSIGGGEGGNTGNGGDATVNIYGGNLTAASIGGGTGSVGGHGGAAIVKVTDGFIETGSIGGGKTNNPNGNLGYAKATISGGDISGQFLMAAGGTEPCSFTMTGGTLHGVDTADNSKFNYAQQNGAAVYMDDPNGVVSISGGTIKECAAQNGGAIYMTAGSCSISGAASIESCTSTQNGGAIYMGGGTLTVDGGTIKNNAAQLDGGAVYLGGGEMTVYAGEISGNKALEGSGGAAYIDGGNVYIAGGDVTGNTTAKNGGGIAVNDGNYSMVGGNVSSNKALSGSGGGIYVSANETDVKVSIFSGALFNNTGTVDGGALAVVGKADSAKTIQVQIGIPEHHFDTEGNIICDHDGVNILDGTITKCPEFSGNQAGESGGGIYVTGSTNTSLNIFCLTEDPDNLNNAAGDNNQSNFMRMEGGKVTITTSNTMKEDNLNDQDAHHGNTQITSTIYVTGGNMALWGEMANPSITQVITVDITKEGDDFNDYRLNTEIEDKRYKLKYFENFKDPVTGVITGQYKEYEILHGSEIIISSNIYSHPGYTIQNWNTGNGYDLPLQLYYPEDVEGTEPSSPRPPKDAKASGWYKINSKYLFDGDPIGDLEIYAIWEPNGYTVIYHPNADSYGGEMGNDAFLYNTESALKKNAYQRPGYDFVGWCIDQTPTEASVIYKDEESVINLTSEKGAVVTLYAQWKECDHTEPAHTYTYRLIGDGTAIKRDCSCGNYSEEVRLSADSFVYDKTNHPAHVVYTSETWKPSVTYEALDGDALVNELPYYAGLYQASATAGGVTASITYTIEKAEQAAPAKPDYTTQLVDGGSVLSVKPVAPSELTQTDPDGYDSLIEYNLVYYVGSEKHTKAQTTAQKLDPSVEYAAQFTVDVVLTNYYVYVSYAEGANYKASAETPADSVYFYAGENVEIIINNPVGILKELKLASDSGDSILENGAALSIELMEGYYFPQNYDSRVTCVATTIPDGQPAEGVQFAIESSCSQYSVHNIKESTRIVITLPNANKLVTVSSRITEGQVFGNVTSDAATISRDSAFTVYYRVTNFVGAEYEAPVLSFNTAMPAGTTIIMLDKQTGQYYWDQGKSGGATGLNLSAFVRMGDANKTPFAVTDGDLKLQFIIDYSRTESGMAGDAVNVTLRITRKTTSGGTKATAECSLRAVDGFSLTEEASGTLTFQRNSSAGFASKWENRDSALVLIPKTTLPADAQLSLVCVDTTKIIGTNCNGHFVYSLPADTVGTISVSLVSSLLPEGISSYDFDVKWIVAESLVEHSPMNAPAVAAIEYTVSCTKQKPVSLKIAADAKLYAVADTVHATISWADIPVTYDMEVVLLVKAADGNYISTGITQPIHFSNSTGTMPVNISLASISNGSYCLQITTDQGLIRIAEARYYFIVQ